MFVIEDNLFPKRHMILKKWLVPDEVMNLLRFEGEFVTQGGLWKKNEEH